MRWLTTTQVRILHLPPCQPDRSSCLGTSLTGCPETLVTWIVQMELWQGMPAGNDGRLSWRGGDEVWRRFRRLHATGVRLLWSVEEGGDDHGSTRVAEHSVCRAGDRYLR